MKLLLRRRPGFGLMAMLVTLAVVSILVTSITMQIVVNRKTVARRESQMQALWLARAGLEIATSKLLVASGYAGEALELVPSSSVRIEVRRDNDLLHITSEAAYAGDLPQPVVRAVSRTYRRVGEGKQERLEPIMPE